MNTFADDISPSEYLAAVHGISNGLSTAKSAGDQSAALSNHVRIISPHLPSSKGEILSLWGAIKDEELIPKLLAIVARKDLDLNDRYMIISHTSTILYISFIAYYSPFDALFREDQEVQKLLDSHTPVFLMNAVSVHFKTQRDHSNAEESYIALGLLARWVDARLSNDTFIEALDVKSILDYVYNIQFDFESYFLGTPGGSSPLKSALGPTYLREVDTTRHCATLLEATATAHTDLCIPSTREAVERYGAKNLVNRCMALFAEDVGDFQHISTSRTLGHYLVTTLHAYHPIYHTFSLHDAYATILDRYWRIYLNAAPDFPPQYIHEDLTILTLYHFQTTLARINDGSGDDCLAASDKLFSGPDFLLLWARVLVLHRDPYPYEIRAHTMEKLRGLIAGYLHHRQHLRNDLLLINLALHVHRCLRAREPYFKEEESTIVHPSSRIAYWEAVIQESFLRSHRQLCGTNAPNLVGCSYVACPLFRDNVVAGKRLMLLCSRCRSAQYCNAKCQRLDWLHSGHKHICSP